MVWVEDGERKERAVWFQATAARSEVAAEDGMRARARSLRESGHVSVTQEAEQGRRERRPKEESKGKTGKKERSGTEPVAHSCALFHSDGP